VEAVRVHHDLRSSGIGTALMQWAIARARERGCWRVELTTNVARIDAHRFYERLGFRRSHIGMKLPL
jgi:GNAT superfamily N-acetyltransferase